MRLEARTHTDWKVIDASTGKRLTNVTMVDGVTNEMEMYVRDEAGKYIIEDDKSVKRIVEQLRSVHLDIPSRTVKVYRK